MLTDDETAKGAYDRRNFVGYSARALMGLNALLLGAASQSKAAEETLASRYGKDGLRLLTERPFNAEAWPHDLDAEVTPASNLFARNNGTVPELAIRGDAANWQLTIDGEVKTPLRLGLDDLKRRFKRYSYQLVLECGGNGRAAIYPGTPGLQWMYGAVGCPRWEGVLLRDVLAAAGVKSSAVYVGYYGHDEHLSGDREQVVISRGVPIAKALDPMTMLAFGMNGGPLPAVHGFPARLVCPGYPASASGKWLKRLWVRDRVHDGPKMEGYAYRVPREPVAPGARVPESAMEIIELMPVKSLITSPRSPARLTVSPNRPFACRGFAWSGHGKVTAVGVSCDYGQTWVPATLAPPVNAFAWQRWSVLLNLPGRGYYEVWARAQDVTGRMQPMVVPGWNPHGYLNNAMPRISLTAV